MVINPARKTTLEVVKKAKFVKIDMEKLQSLAHRLLKKNIKAQGWAFDFHLKTDSDDSMLDYIILLDSMNFCFWAKSGERWEYEYKEKKWNGYYAMALALKCFFEENPEKGNLEYFKNISFKEFKDMLQGGKQLQFLSRRWEIVKEVSAYILKKYGNSKNMVIQGERMFLKLIPIFSKLPSFDDFHMYKGKRIHILKRAQILGGDIMGEFNNKGIGQFLDPEYLTMFADYRIPQILNSWGVLEYVPKLQEKVQKKDLIKSGSEAEIEIRSACIWAVEYLKEELGKMGLDLYSYQMDWLLWNESQRTEMKYPYHRTSTIYY